MAYRFNGVRVSKPWHTVLTEYDRRSRHPFRVNSGRRTIAEQWRLYRLYKAGKGNLAAYPNPAAPHINYGRANHAIDVENTAEPYAGGADRLVRWLTSRGVNATRPVPGEPWHIQVPRDQLVELARSIERKKPRTPKRPRRRTETRTA